MGMQVFNSSDGYKPVNSPERWDIPGIMNTLQYCKPVRDRLCSVKKAFGDSRRFRNNTLHSAKQEKTEEELDAAVSDCHALLDAVEALDGLHGEVAERSATARRLLERLRNRAPPYLMSVFRAACKPQVDTDSYRLVMEAFNEWFESGKKPILWVEGKRGTGKVPIPSFPFLPGSLLSFSMLFVSRLQGQSIAS